MYNPHPRLQELQRNSFRSWMPWFRPWGYLLMMQKLLFENASEESAATLTRSLPAHLALANALILYMKETH